VISEVVYGSHLTKDVFCQVTICLLKIQDQIDYKLIKCLGLEVLNLKRGFILNSRDVCS
jgi:hypothetical protein